MAKLRDVLTQPDQLPPDAVLYAVRPWTATTDVVVAEADAPPDGHEYMLEVDVVLDVLRVWSAWRDGVLPTQEEAAEAARAHRLHRRTDPGGACDALVTRAD